MPIKMDNKSQIIKVDENRAKLFIENHNLIVEKYDNKNDEEKRPDFRVLDKNDLLFFAEVKTFFSNTNEQILHKTIYNKFSERINDAYKQFKSVNSLRMVPNVLFLFSQDFRVDWNKFQSFLNGYYDYGTGFLNLKKFRDGRNIKSLQNIDLYIWLYNDFQKLFYINNDYSFTQRLYSILGK
jgi:hypothetical protein